MGYDRSIFHSVTSSITLCFDLRDDLRENDKLNNTLLRPTREIEFSEALDVDLKVEVA